MTHELVEVTEDETGWVTAACSCGVTICSDLGVEVQLALEAHQREMVR